MYEVIQVENLCYSEQATNEFLLDLYLPKGKAEFPLLIFFHGGGFESNDKQIFKGLGVEFARLGVAFAVPNYRKYPIAEYPEFIEDAAKAVSSLQTVIKQYGTCKHIFVGGHSAGAYLAMMLCFDKKYLGKYGIKPMDLSGCVFASGQPTTHFNILKHRGLNEKTIMVDEAAPLYHVSQEGPSLLILCAEHDMENRWEQTQLFVSTLKHFQYKSKVQFQLMEGYGHSDYVEEKNGDGVFPVIEPVIKFVEEVMCSS